MNRIHDTYQLTRKLSQRYIFLVLLIASSCQGQERSTSRDKYVGGPCQGCEAIYEMPFNEIFTVDTIDSFNQKSPKINIFGRVLHVNGNPQSDVIIYYYHTDENGIYPKKGDEIGWGKRHGYLRGWVKSDENGVYSIYTFRPTAYPNGNEPEHIHLVIKERGYKEYYIDDITFSDDPLLTNEEINSLSNRGGNGIVELTEIDGIMTGSRDIILGKNIPDYK